MSIIAKRLFQRAKIRFDSCYTALPSDPLHLLGIFLILLCVGLVGGCSYLTLWILFPIMFSAPSTPWLLVLVNYLAASWLSMLILFNYYMVVTTGPGQPPRKDTPEYGLSAPSSSEAVKFCPKCDSWKPDRCHHCSICGKCVLRMDHHCPWINNCVGHRNHRYFFLFLLYLWLGCIYFSIVSWLSITRIQVRAYRLIGSREFLSDTELEVLASLSTNVQKFVFIGFALAVMMIFALAALGGFHFYLILSNQTTLEFMSNSKQIKSLLPTSPLNSLSSSSSINEYDLGRWRNLITFFNTDSRETILNGQGRKPWWYALLPIPVQPNGDGLFYLTQTLYLSSKSVYENNSSKYS